MSQKKRKARVIAFYLPQFHPIAENDEWWGKGFTEWTNVGKAKPYFKNHYQPRVPADLGYYDLRMPEVREAQAAMAQKAGIEGFCYWRYWFGNGRQLLERPFKEVLESGKPDFPFCLGWANHTWSSKTWEKGVKSEKDSVLVEQTYPGEDEHRMHFYEVLEAFKDKRYIQVDGKPMFVVYDPLAIPDVKSFIELWNNLAKENGLKGVHFVGIKYNLTARHIDKNNIEKHYWPKKSESSAARYNEVLDLGFDAVNSRGLFRAELAANGRFYKLFLAVIKNFIGEFLIEKYSYNKIIKHLFVEEDKWENVYPTIIPNWDRTPRGGKMATVYYGSTPELFQKNIEDAIDIVKNKEEDHKIIFLMSWNEWAEGNYVEPDLKYGNGYLEAIEKSLF